MLSGHFLNKNYLVNITVFFISFAKLVFLIWSAIYHQLIVENVKPTSCMQCVCIHFLKGFCWIKAVYLNCLYPKETEFHHVLGIKISGMLFVLQSFVLKSFGLQNICSADHLSHKSFVLKSFGLQNICSADHLSCNLIVLQVIFSYKPFVLQIICTTNILSCSLFVLLIICPKYIFSYKAFIFHTMFPSAGKTSVFLQIYWPTLHLSDSLFVLHFI